MSAPLAATALAYQARPDLLAGRVILITGVGHGLGRHLALACARYGATVAMVSRSQKKLETLYDEIVAAGCPEPLAIQIELGQATDQALHELANHVYKTLGQLDGVVHNAQYFAHLSPLQQQTLSEWEAMYKMNVAIPFALNKALFPLLKKAGDASILLIGETHALQPKAYWGGYAVAKAAQITYLQVASDEWESVPQLRMNVLIPGPVQSPFRIKTHPAEDRSQRAQPDTLLPAYLYLLGEDSRAVRGQVIDLGACHPR
jgi:NAD(P)-dependent dehydrogenase (short-subunit alcohol dehydrogenase family)